MAEIIGREIEFGVAVEASRGSGETTADKWVKNVTANVVERADRVMDDATRGRLEDMDGSRVVSKYIEGDLDGIVHVDTLGYFLANLYGIVVSSNVAGSVYSHVFTLGQNIQHPSLTLFAKDGGVQQQIFSNAMISTLELSAAVDEYVRFNAGFVAKASTDNSDTPSYDTEYDFIGRDLTLKIADDVAGLSGATAIKAKDVNITFDTGAIRDHVVGSLTPDDIYNAKMSIEGSFTVNFADETFKDLYLGDTDKVLQIVIEGEADIGGGNKPTITILLYKVNFTDWNRSGGNDELVTEPISFKAFYSPSDSKASQVTLKNLTSSYANVPSS